MGSVQEVTYALPKSHQDVSFLLGFVQKSLTHRMQIMEQHLVEIDPEVDAIMVSSFHLRIPSVLMC